VDDKKGGKSESSKDSLIHTSQLRETQIAGYQANDGTFELRKT